MFPYNRVEYSIAKDVTYLLPSLNIRIIQEIDIVFLLGSAGDKDAKCRSPPFLDTPLYECYRQRYVARQANPQFFTIAASHLWDEQ